MVPDGARSPVGLLLLPQSVSDNVYRGQGGLHGSVSVLRVSRVERLGDCFKSKLVCALVQHWSHLSKLLFDYIRMLTLKMISDFICTVMFTWAPYASSMLDIHKTRSFARSPK